MRTQNISSNIWAQNIYKRSYWCCCKAGLATSPHPVPIEDFLAINIRQNKVTKFVCSLHQSVDCGGVKKGKLWNCHFLQVGKVIEECEQEWPEEGRRQYHGNSRLKLKVRHPAILLHWKLSKVECVLFPYNIVYYAYVIQKNKHCMIVRRHACR